MAGCLSPTSYTLLVLDIQKGNDTCLHFLDPSPDSNPPRGPEEPPLRFPIVIHSGSKIRAQMELSIREHSQKFRRLIQREAPDVIFGGDSEYLLQLLAGDLLDEGHQFCLGVRVRVTTMTMTIATTITTTT